VNLAAGVCRCTECGVTEPRDDLHLLACRGCGAAVHDACYFEFLTPPAERLARLDAAAPHAPWLENAIICRWCRS
jgi:hypothetical protein